MVENTIKRIKQYIDFRGMKVSAFEREVGMSNGSFASQLKNDKTIGVDKLENILNRYPDINVEWLMYGVGDMCRPNILNENAAAYLRNGKPRKNLNIPLYDSSTAAEIVELFGDHNHQRPVDTISMPNISDCDGAMYVAGDSMSPLLRNRDIVIYKILKNPEENIIWGEMYLIYVNNDGNENFFTRILKKSDRDSFVQFVAQNPDHQTFEFPLESIKAIALVKASIRINSQF
ncbi:S24 family peptidase [Flavobacterium gelatinilyticum]|uniref:S24 family peptidase n=1 Tax=Flavobacterium gelatinilyticum TaxID=3003260 RepID=UPI0024811D3F|nr:S24 family peptidase [Flavobacterium gelatinilyticum]